MRKLLFIPFIIGIGISFNSCNFGDTGNIANYSSPAVVDFRIDMGGTVLFTQLGPVATPSLFDYYPGECVYVQFTIDYDNQPSTEYFTATEVVCEPVNQSYLEQTNSFEVGEYKLPIYNIDTNTSAFYKGKFFILTVTKDKEPNFRLVYNLEETETEKDGVKNLYLLAQPSSASQSSTDYSSLFAFDLRDFVYNQGRDTTFTTTSGKEEYKYVKTNVKYVSSISDAGNPVFQNASDPFLIFISKDF